MVISQAKPVDLLEVRFMADSTVEPSLSIVVALLYACTGIHSEVLHGGQCFIQCMFATLLNTLGLARDTVECV